MNQFLIQGQSIDELGATTTYMATITPPDISNAAQVQTNLFYGFLLFFIVVVGIVGFFSHKFK